jgi:hypothetical protein
MFVAKKMRRIYFDNQLLNSPHRSIGHFLVHPRRSRQSVSGTARTCVLLRYLWSGAVRSRVSVEPRANGRLSPKTFHDSRACWSGLPIHNRPRKC